MNRPSDWGSFLPHHLDDDITLTLLSPSDTEAFYVLVDENREHLRRWFRWVDGYKSVADAEAFAEDSLRRMAERSGMTCLVWYRDQMAGLVVLLNVDLPKRQTEIGFWMGKAFERRGIARKAVAALIGHAFDCLGFELILAKVNRENQRSLALLEALGFASEEHDGSIVCRLAKGDWLWAGPL
ncbi:MAG: GNAT family N-acetyltransferase [Candidatus Latescibacteria bacterium]|jgi:ribosomal-protein-serine acetyltransferase|nr:GNAT family N-acetyltransferase [Candidatus Latescibacterota bacterium]